MSIGNFNDRAFSEAVANDRELSELLSSRPVRSKAAILENISMLGDCIHIGGRVYPMHTLGTYEVLNAIGHPLAGKSAGSLKEVDVLIVLYLLFKREKAVALLAGYWQEKISEEKLVKEIFAVIPGFDDWNRVIDDLAELFNMIGGFAAFPDKQSDGAQKSNTGIERNNLLELAGTIIEVYPSMSVFDIIWRTPYPMTGHLFKQAMQKKGFKNFVPSTQTDEAWRRFKSISEQFGK